MVTSILEVGKDYYIDVRKILCKYAEWEVGYQKDTTNELNCGIK